MKIRINCHNNLPNVENLPSRARTLEQRILIIELLYIRVQQKNK